VRHLELDLCGSGIDYAPGDAIAVQPRNPPAAVDALLYTLGVADPHARLCVTPNSPLWRAWLGAHDTTAHEIFSTRLDVFGVARRPFFALLAHFATDSDEKERLEEFGDPQGVDELAAYATRPRRTCAEVLADFRSARPPLARYLDLIPPLRQRYFSISSSPLLHPTTAHLTVAVVRYKTLMHEPRLGVCSNYLASLPVGATVRIWLRTGCLQMPPEPTQIHRPLLLIGPGTGVAPLRAILQHRAAGNAATGAAGEAVLYFGCRSRRDDFLYEEEWRALLERRVLSSLHTAFSRETEQKCYVQHRMAESEQSLQLWRLLRDSCTYIYVAGAANQMPKAVRAALSAAAMAHGGLSQDAALAMLARLEAERRLQFETW